jgi:hypothetical protein
VCVYVCKREKDARKQKCFTCLDGAQVVDDQRYGPGPAEVHSRDAYSGTLEDAVLHNTNQVCVYVCACVYLCTCLCVSVCIYVCTNMLTHVYTALYSYTRM